MGQQLVLDLPRDNSLPGQVGYFQAFNLDPNANPAGMTASNAVGVSIGLL